MVTQSQNNHPLAICGEINLNFTRVIDFGIPLKQLLGNQTEIPLQGARINIAFEGEISGLLRGKVTGTKYINVRADGRFALHTYADIVTNDNQPIFFESTGSLWPQGNGISALREDIQLTTSVSEYEWVNNQMFIADGFTDTNKGTVDTTLMK